MGVRRWAPEVLFDSAVFLAGLVLGLVSVVVWTLHGNDASFAALIAVGLVVVLARYPLVLRHQVGDVVIGFEASALVFLVLTLPVMQALAFWSIATVAAQALSSNGRRARLFNIGVTVLGGGAFVWVASRVSDLTVLSPLRLTLLMAGCACYFITDLTITSVSLSIESRVRLRSSVRWQSVWLGLVCFVGVDTLGYLAALLHRNEPAWTLALLLAPIGTILVAVSSVSRSRLAQQRLVSLFEAATEAPDWPDELHVERTLVDKAELILRRSSAILRPEAPGESEIGARVAVPGVADRYLVAARKAGASRAPYDSDDQQALLALAAIGEAALNRQRMAGEMTYLARHDVLTGLSNRVVLSDRLDHALARRGGRAAVLYCDLDGFKAVNDRYGHSVGDLLLMAVGRRLQQLVRTEDTVARIGGDEFAVLLDDAGTATHAERLAQRVLEELHRPFEVSGRSVRIGVSVGVAVSAGGESGESGEDLLRDADIAMYQVKSHGRGGLYLFQPSMRAESLRRLELQEDLRQAVDDGAIRVVYQPVVQLTTGHIEGFEALARWTHPRLGEIPPDVFIPLAEQLGLIPRLGGLVLTEAHSVGREMAAGAGRPFTMGVNLSPLQLEDPNLVPTVARLVRSDPSVTLMLELTEGTLLEDDERTVDVLTALRTAGALLAVDDFGVGYSSVSYLHRLPVELVKVDRSFVQNMLHSRRGVLVEGIIAMATAMNLRVVAEGVEDWATVAALEELGCYLGQGFLFARPLACEAALELAVAGQLERPADAGLLASRPV